MVKMQWKRFTQPLAGVAKFTTLLFGAGGEKHALDDAVFTTMSVDPLLQINRHNKLASIPRVFIIMLKNKPQRVAKPFKLCELATDRWRSQLGSYLYP